MTHQWRLRWGDVRAIWMMEIRTLLRSGRTVTTALVLPLVITPIMLVTTRYALTSEERRADDAVYHYAVTGNWAEPVRELIDSGIDTASVGSFPTTGSARGRYAEVVVGSDPESAVANGELDFYIHAVSGPVADAAARAATEAASEPPGGGAGRLPGVPLVEVRFPANRTRASAGATEMIDILTAARRSRVDATLQDRGFGLGFADVLPLESRNLATPVETTGLLVGRFLTLGLFMLILTGGSLVAMDIVAGEKERGTLETLLTTATGRREIIVAKQGVILAAAVVITLIQLGNLAIYTGFDLVPLPEGFDFGFSTAAAIAMLTVLLPMAVLLAGLLLLVSAASRSYKEAQLYFFPLYLVGMIPAAAGALDIPLRSAIAILPVAGVSVAVRDVLSGQIDWPLVVVVALVNAVAAGAALGKAARMLDDESIATSRQSSPLASLDGAAAFRANVWKWIAVIWALFIGLGIFFPDLVSQVVMTQFVLLLGGVLVALGVYRLDPVETLGLRLPRWTTWPIVLALVAPLHALAGLVMRFANTIFPVPETYLQQIEQQFAPLETLPWFAAVLLIAFAPGLCEEVAFRGLFFFGLERRYRGVALAIVVGSIFGFFHFDLSRIVMAGTLGVFLTAARILTGSLLPGIVMHIANNSLALVLARAEVPVDRLDPSVYGVSVVATAGLFAMLWRENAKSAGRHLRPPASTGSRLYSE